MGSVLQPETCVQNQKNNGICERHFDAEFKKKGEKNDARNTLRRELDPVPSNYCVDIPPSMMPTPSPPARKPPTKRPYQPDQLEDFQRGDEIGRI